MAEKITLAEGEVFAFSTGGSRASNYPWDQWFDGGIWEISAAEWGMTDTDRGPAKVDRQGFKLKARSAAWRRDVVVEFSDKDRWGHPLTDSVVLRARDMSPDELVENERRRAEVAAKVKADQQRRRLARTNGETGDTISRLQEEHDELSEPKAKKGKKAKTT